MTSREIIAANLRCECDLRPGLTFDGGRHCDVQYAGPGASPTWQPRRWTEGDREFYDDEWGNVWYHKVGGTRGEVHQPAIADWSQLEGYQPPDYADPARWAGMAAAFAQPSDRFRLACIGGWVFDNARYLRKMAVYFLDMAAEPELLRRLNDLVAGVYETKIHWAARCGADGVMIGEDLGTQTGLLFSPAMFRGFFKPTYIRLMGLAHDYGLPVLMHSCGNNAELIEDLCDCGVDAFQFDQPAVYDLPALATQLRRRKRCLWSPTDIQKVLPTGDRDLIVAETRRMFDLFAGGLIHKNYPDLRGIGVAPEWDEWAYEAGLAWIEEHGGRTW